MGKSIDELIDRADLELDIEDVRMDREQLRLLGLIRRDNRLTKEAILATLEDVKAAVAESGAEAQAAGERVIARLEANDAAAAAANQLIEEQRVRIQELIDGNAEDVTPEVLQELLDGVNAIGEKANAIVPATAEEPPVEPPVGGEGGFGTGDTV